jgi:N utilization substance protein B
MGTRRQARELAMQALFYMDMQDNVSSQMLESFCENFRPPKKARPFFLTLVNGVLETINDIDARIERFSKNWKIHRMSCVDRNVMRIAVYELLHCEDIPPKVSINEAVDIGKKFGTEDSGAFINGIMDSIREALDKEGKLNKIAAQVDDGMT